MFPPLEEPAEHGMRELDDVRGERAGRPVQYLEEDPGAPSQGEVFQHEPPCPECGRGVLTRSRVARGEMLTCRRGCGQRFWLDR